MEKGKVSVRLSSVQDEQHQLRNDMETLRVSMQADENILEKLKGSQSKNDSFQDKVEKLESQLQMAGENQEMVILHAEYSEGEVETLKSQIQSMKEHLRASELDLITIRSKNENLTQQLQEKLGKVSESDMLLSSHKHLLEAKEQENQQMQEESKAAVEMLKTKWKELMKEVAALCEDPGTRKIQEQSLGFPMQGVHWLTNTIKKLKVQIDDDEKKQMQVLGKPHESKRQADMHRDRVENLEKDLKKSKKSRSM